MVLKIKAKFDNGVFWEQYNDLERQFLNFLEYVPYFDQNKEAVSFRLASLVLSIGGYVDSAFKEMARYPKFYRTTECREIRNRAKKRMSIIALCLRFFEDKYGLSKKRVIFKRLPERETVFPFAPANPRNGAPAWWDAYNGLKHEFSRNFYRANLVNTRDALAAAFLLNVRHISGAVRLSEYGFMKAEIRTPQGRVRGIAPSPDPNTVKKILEEGNGIAGVFVETTLFIFDYMQ